MTSFEWFLLIVVVIAVPLVVAVVVTLWTLEQARQRKRSNRDAGTVGTEPVKRRATRSDGIVVVGEGPAGEAERPGGLASPVASPSSGMAVDDASIRDGDDSGGSR